MQKIQLLLTAMLFAIITVASAQPSIGVRVGYNVTGVSGDIVSAYPNVYIQDDANVKGFSVGIPVAFNLSENFAIQPEIHFNQKGFGYKSISSVDNNYYDFDYNFNYLEIPALAKLSLGSETFKFNILAGPGVGLGFGKIKENVNEGFIETDYSYEEFSAKKFDFGIHAGVGLTYNLDPVSIFLDARYYQGLGQVSDNSVESYKHRGISLGIGAMYNLQ